MGGIVYFIKCLETDEVYIGSTKGKLQIRMNCHKSHTECKSRQIIERGNYFYDTLEVVEDDKDILIREQHYMDTMKNCINAHRAYTTPEQKLEYDREYSRQYYQENSDKLNEERLKRYHYQNSWGGDKRNTNNLLLIDINLFHY